MHHRWTATCEVLTYGAISDPTVHVCGRCVQRVQCTVCVADQLSNVQRPTFNKQPEMVQKEFGFSISEAHTFMSWIEIGVKFKDENLGESGNDREQMAHQLKNMKAS